jgi:hypothetical protein
MTTQPTYERLCLAAVALVVACGTDAPTGSDQLAFEPTFDKFANAEWSEPVNLGSIVNSAGIEIEVSISKDGLSLYIASNRSGNFDIWVSHRESDDEPWGPPQPLGPAINTAAREQAPFISRDGHRLYFFSDREAVGGTTDIYVSRRRNKRDDFGWEAPVNLGSGVNSTANETLPVLFEDDATGTTTLYFSSNRAGSVGADIYASTLQADGTFGPAAMVAELSSPRRDRVLTIRRDGLEIFLRSIWRSSPLIGPVRRRFRSTYGWRRGPTLRTRGPRRSISDRPSTAPPMREVQRSRLTKRPSISSRPV